MLIRKASPADSLLLAQLACRLWPHHTPAELEPEFNALVVSPEAACFLAFDMDEAIGFAQCQLRHDYVEGTQTSPVGYLEGIFVWPEFRHRGLAKQLLGACESWAKEKGCMEFASDCELGNDASLNFHLSMGFTEVNRIVCFTKTLRDRRAE